MFRGNHLDNERIIKNVLVILYSKMQRESEVWFQGLLYFLFT